jgi:hypothetical protein
MYNSLRDTLPLMSVSLLLVTSIVYFIVMLNRIDLSYFRKIVRLELKFHSVKEM